MVIELHKRTLKDDWKQPAFSRILMSGKAFVADVSGALFWPAEETLIVSDLHLERRDEIWAADTQLPSDDSRATLSRLADVIDYYHPSRVIAVGHSLPDLGEEDGLESKDLDKLHDLQSGRNWVWVGDGVEGDTQKRFGGAFESAVNICGLTFRNSPVMAPVSHEIAGGMHPMAKVSRQGRQVTARCFISTGTRLVMPAFGAQSHGANVLDDMFSPIFGSEMVFVWMAGWSEVYPVAARQLLED